MSRAWIFGLLCVLLPLSPARADRTRLQDAMERKGVLLRRLTAGGEGVLVSELGGMPDQRRLLYLDAVAVYEPLSADPEKSCARGVRVSPVFPGAPRPVNQFPEYNSGWLDLDECAAVLKALRHVHAALTMGGAEYPQFRLVTRGGLIISTSETPLSGAQTLRSIFVSYPVFVTTDGVRMNAQELDQVIRILEKTTAAAQALKVEK